MRTSARRAVRHAARALLARYSACPQHAVTLHSTPGQPPCMTLPDGHTVHVSFSYDEPLCGFAVHLAGPVGMDIVAPLHHPAWPTECLDLAHDYLGPDCHSQLHALPPAHRPPYFAHAWAAREACLKQAGWGLVEWAHCHDKPLPSSTSYSFTVLGTWTVSVAL